MKKSIFKISCLIIFLGVISFQSCDRLNPCGIFTFTGNLDDQPGSNSLPMNLSFDFNPADCGSDCSCDPVCYIQIVRNIDLEDFTYIYPSAEKEDRATGYGWYIDRIEGRKWGYYGRNDNGTFGGNLNPGNNTDPAILFDTPSRGEAEPWLEFWWQAVSVPVCIDDDATCENKLLGFYFWGFTVDNAGIMGGPLNAVAWENLDQSVFDAVSEWNTQAPGLGKNSFPAFTKIN